MNCNPNCNPCRPSAAQGRLLVRPVVAGLWAARRRSPASRLVPGMLPGLGGRLACVPGSW